MGYFLIKCNHYIMQITIFSKWYTFEAFGDSGTVTPKAGRITYGQVKYAVTLYRKNINRLNSRLSPADRFVLHTRARTYTASKKKKKTKPGTALQRRAR